MTDQPSPPPAPEPKPASPLPAEEKFKHLERRWRQATGAMSLEHHKVGDMAYLQIIAMQDDALPSIFKQLQNGRRFWFVALAAITGEENLVPKGATLEQASAIWLQWGRQHGFV